MVSDGRQFDVDAGVVEGDEVGGRFDPMLAKIIACGHDRADALDRLTRALDATVLARMLADARFPTRREIHGEAVRRRRNRFEQSRAQRANCIESGVASSLEQVDLVLWVIDIGEGYGPGERYVRETLRKSRKPVMLVINKIDTAPRPRILPAIEQYRQFLDFVEIVPWEGERERFDGADVLHLLRDCAEHLDWERILRRFGPHWRVLFAHLVLFGFVFPGDRDRVPSEITRRLIARYQGPRAAAAARDRVFHGVESRRLPADLSARSCRRHCSSRRARRA